MNNLFQCSGRSQRIEFILVFSALAIFWLFFAYILRNTFDLNPSSDYFFEIKLIIDFVALASFTPIMLRRLHDINLPGYILILFWISVPFNIRNLVYFSNNFNIQLDPFSVPVMVLDFMILFILVMCIFYRSYSHSNHWGSGPNKQFNPDSGADAPPPVN